MACARDTGHGPAILRSPSHALAPGIHDFVIEPWDESTPAEAAASLRGAAPTDEAFAEAGRLAADASNPVSDVRGTDTYKRHMVEVYTRRGLATASAMAAG